MGELILIEPMKQPSSNAAQAFIKKAFQFVTLNNLDIGWSIGVPSDGITYNEAKAFADAYSVGKKRFIVVQHENIYEIARVVDDAPLDLYYKKPKAEKIDVVYDNAYYVNLVRRAVQSYLALDDDKLKSYITDTTLRSQGVIPYHYIQRKLYYYKAIVNSTGRAATVQRACELACESQDHLLTRIDKGEGLLQYGTSAVLFRFNTNAAR